LLVTDQGVRGFLHVLNDLCFLAAPKLGLRAWQVQPKAGAGDAAAVSDAVKSLHKEKFSKFLETIAKELASFDWRTSGDPSVTEVERREKLVFRGGSGYKEIRTQLLEHLSFGDAEIAKLAERLI
jgi:hypothetical protein